MTIGAHLYDAVGKLLNFDFHAEPLTDPPREIAPGESVRCRVTLPGLTWPVQAGVRLRGITRDVVRAGGVAAGDVPGGRNVTHLFRLEFGALHLLSAWLQRVTGGS